MQSSPRAQGQSDKSWQETKTGGREGGGEKEKEKRNVNRK